MITANGNAIAGGALASALVDLLVSKGVLDRSKVGNLVASAMARLNVLGQTADIQAARDTLSALAQMHAGRNG